MAPRIAIPLPHGSDPAYAERAIPQYEHALRLAGGEPVRIPLNQGASAVLRLIDGCDGVLLPGSKADIDPAKFKADRSAQTAAADPQRDAVDDLLLNDAYQHRKPVLGICYGLQSLNVYCGGSLVQHIPDFLPESTRGKVNHEAGKKVSVAHTVEVEAKSALARILDGDNHPRSTNGAQELIVPVNSSHHQSAKAIGDGLRVVARCVEDGIIEALEGTAPEHFVLAVQWHPERSVDDDEASRAIFRGFVTAAECREKEATRSKQA
jgi:putative glutamine amidotransferase